MDSIFFLAGSLMHLGSRIRLRMLCAYANALAARLRRFAELPENVFSHDLVLFSESKIERAKLIVAEYERSVQIGEEFNQKWAEKVAWAVNNLASAEGEIFPKEPWKLYGSQKSSYQVLRIAARIEKRAARVREMWK